MSNAPVSAVNKVVYRAEQRVVGLCMAVMGTAVFLDVVHRVASREQGLLHRWSGGASWANPVGTAAGLLVAWGLTFAALRARGNPPSGATWGKAAGITAVAYAALRAFLVLLPNGLVWSQTLGLVLMLAVGCFGASTAAQEHRHLALDLGSKLWPKKILPYVQALGNLLTALFCVVLVVLSVVSIKSHYGDYVDTAGAGGAFVALPIPKYLAFMVIPVAFTVMAVRFFGQALVSARGHVEEDDPLQMLGIKDANAGGGDSGVAP